MGKAAFLYVIADGSGAHKIGLSVSPKKRLGQLQTGSPRRLALVRASEEPLPEPDEIEAYAHWLLQEARALGEWFNVTEDAAWVALVAASEAVARGERAPGRGLSPRLPKSRWQNRAATAGLSQKELARLLGVAENTVSLQLRGKWQSSTPRYVKTLIRAWELLPQAQREALMDGAEEE